MATKTVTDPSVDRIMFFAHRLVDLIRKSELRGNLRVCRCSMRFTRAYKCNHQSRRGDVRNKQTSPLDMQLCFI